MKCPECNSTPEGAGSMEERLIGTRTCPGCGGKLVPNGKAFMVFFVVFLLVNLLLRSQLLEATAWPRTLSAAAAVVASLIALNLMSRAGYVARASASYDSPLSKVIGAVVFIVWACTLVARDLWA